MNISLQHLSIKPIDVHFSARLLTKDLFMTEIDPDNTYYSEVTQVTEMNTFKVSGFIRLKHISIQIFYTKFVTKADKSSCFRIPVFRHI